MSRFRAGQRYIVVAALVGACGSPPRETKAAADSGAAVAPTIRLTPEQVASAGITIGDVVQRPLGIAIEASAQIEAMPDRVGRVGSRVAGRIVRVAAGVGDVVREGAVLAVVDSPDLARAKADYLSTLAAANLARATADREKALFERRISAEREWRQAEADAIRADSEKEAAENRLHSLGVPDAELAALQNEGHYTSTVSLTAPLSGTVVERSASIGQAVEPADLLFSVMDLRQVWIVMDVFEKDLRFVSAGQSAIVTVPAYPGVTFAGRVANVGVVLEPQTRAAKVRVVLANPDGRLKAGMFATVEIQAATRGAGTGMFVPAGAVQRDGADSVVFVSRADGAFEPRRITSGQVSRQWIQVLTGLSLGDRIAVTGSFTLKAEWRKSEFGESEEH
ncbi:MAG: efflux RND transporter periplasmic adaptor subunit [Gemmatimonadetes bacterium]|nr:efflux RND transporter periplasmic adaptor subunit [Gemmatimonadota bacterium]